MQSVHSKTLTTFAVAIILQSVGSFNDDYDNECISEHVLNESQYPPIALLPPKDVYGEIHRTVRFKPHTGTSELLFDYIRDGIAFRFTEARNIYFEYNTWWIW